ncbi:MAG: ABC transporter ATP-binding protein [Rubrivivax sp.]
MLLQIDRLSKSFGDTAVLCDVTLALDRGEFVALVGASGVGKSTLLNCIAALEPPDRGTITVDGARIDTLGDDAAAHWRRQRLGFVFQAFHLLPHLSVAENVELPLRLLGRPDAARVEGLLDTVGLAGLGARAPAQLSGGQLQRVAIARAVVHRPALILADEPTGNLDPASAARVLALLRAQVGANGSACLLVTHSDVAARGADRILRLEVDGVHAAT